MAANIAFINGRICSEPELKQTNNGKSVMSFSVAVRASENATDFIPVTAWGKTAEFIAKYFSKGDGINIFGKISTHEWEKDGVKRKMVDVTAREVGFPDAKKTQTASAAPADNPFAGAADATDSELPF